MKKKLEKKVFKAVPIYPIWVAFLIWACFVGIPHQSAAPVLMLGSVCLIVSILIEQINKYREKKFNGV